MMLVLLAAAWWWFDPTRWLGQPQTFQRVYRWTDAAGVNHSSDRPPEQGAHETLGIPLDRNVVSLADHSEPVEADDR